MLELIKMAEKEGDLEKKPPEEEGDPSKVEIIRPAPTLGPGGFEQRNDAFIALGEEEDLLAMLRARGWSEEAIGAFRSGEVVVMRLEKDLFGQDMIIPGSEDWLSKMKREGRKTVGGK